MTVQSKTAARPSSVTTGPIAGSRKIYTSPDGRPDIHVPFREVALEPTAREEPYRAYDTSGPYTDPAITIDLEAGLPPVRAEWIAKRGFDRTTVRDIAGEAGVNQALLFRYFGSKEALFEEVIARGGREHIANTPPERLFSASLRSMLR